MLIESNPSLRSVELSNYGNLFSIPSLSGGAHYLIEHGRDGLLVPEGNVAALADALQSLKQNPGLARRLGENGLSKVQRLFVVDKVATELRAVLKV